MQKQIRLITKTNEMKNSLCLRMVALSFLVFATCCTQAFEAREITNGMSRAEVIDILGFPMGRSYWKGRESLFYSRGKVELLNEKVDSHKLMSIDELEKKDLQMQERRFEAEAEQLMVSKNQLKANYKIIQMLSVGTLCRMGAWDETIGKYIYQGSFFLIIEPSVSKKWTAEGDSYCDDFYWAGTYTYTTTEGVESTVHSYSFNKDVAIKAIREKFDLYDKSKTQSLRKNVSNGSNDVPINQEVREFGTGFIISKDGYLLTNDHVVREASKIKIRTADGIYPARIILQDSGNDIALLKIDGDYQPVYFSNKRIARLGQTIFTVGFPIPDIQGFSPKVTRGVVSSLRGVLDDIRTYQIDAAIQAGNSGAPLADENGNVIGIVQSTIKEGVVLESTGGLPQTVNYAVKMAYILALVDNHPEAAIQIQKDGETAPISFEDAVERVKKATVLVVAY